MKTIGENRKWRLNHSSLYLDFLAGNQKYDCTPWGNPTRNIFGWQKPCYLLVEEGYAHSFDELMSETDWHRYGTGNNSKCNNCMAHCGYEGTAVEHTVSNPFAALGVYLFGSRLNGPMAPELPVVSETPSEPPAAGHIEIPLEQIAGSRALDEG